MPLDDLSSSGANRDASLGRELLQSSTLEEARNAILTATATAMGSTRGFIMLGLPPAKTHESAWSAESGLVESLPDVPAEFLEGLRRESRAHGTAVTRPEPSPRGALWTCVPIPGVEDPQGFIALDTDSPEGANALAHRLPGMAARLAVRMGELNAESNLRQEKKRNASWFKTLDDQLRILEGERQKLAALVNSTDAAVFVAGPDGLITWANQIMTRTYGEGSLNAYPVGGRCSILCGSNEQECVDCPIKLVREGRSFVHQERREQRDGETRQLYVSAFPVRAPEGHVKEVLVMIQDLTDLESLKRSEARYFKLFERSADAILMADPKSMEIVMANQQARQLLGLDPSEKPAQNLLVLHPAENREMMREHYQRLSEGTTLENIEVEVLGASGETLTCNACGTLFDLDGTEVILTEFRDVTQVRALQRELTQADHLITLGTMNAGIAHEFKNRLAPLRAFAQLVSMQQPQLDRVMGRAPMMIAEIDRLNALVKDILDYARPQDPNREEAGLASILNGVEERIQSEDMELPAGVDFVCVIPENGDFRVEVDSGHIVRALSNVLENAFHAAGKQPSPRVELHLEQESDTIRVRVIDNGPGIPEEDLDRIFDPFFTTKGPGGTGLGMSITKSLIEANHGRINIASSENGTEVALLFSRYPAETKAEEAA